MRKVIFKVKYTFPPFIRLGISLYFHFFVFFLHLRLFLLLLLFSHLQGEQQEERPLRGVVALQDLARPLREQRGGVLSFLAPGHALIVVEIVAAQPRAVT